MIKYLWGNKYYTLSAVKKLSLDTNQWFVREAIKCNFCDYCETEIVDGKRRYCCDAHRQAAYRDRKLSETAIPKNEEKVCPSCGETFTSYKRKGVEKKYCSVRCRFRANYVRAKEKRGHEGEKK